MFYKNFSGYLKSKYNKKIKKICIDGGFTCPNRDGTCGTGGCIFCGERGAGEHISSEMSISDQVKNYFASNPNADGFIAYFQNFTNTYAPVSVLKQRYDSALTDERIVALSVGTRPDCITEEVAELLSSYKNDYDVWVELGLQTSNDKTANIINRCYSSSVFDQAVKILEKYNIPVVVHIIIGLPGETKEDVSNTVNFINKFNLWGIKIHSIYVMKNTVLEKMYYENNYEPPTLDNYVDQATYVLCNISPNMIVHRLTGDCPAGLLVAPEWNRDKNKVIRLINMKMEENGWVQGCHYSRKR